MKKIIVLALCFVLAMVLFFSWRECLCYKALIGSGDRWPIDANITAIENASTSPETISLILTRCKHNVPVWVQLINDTYKVWLYGK